MVQAPFKHDIPPMIADRWLIEVIAHDADSTGVRPSSDVSLYHCKLSIKWRGVGSGELVISYADPAYYLIDIGNYIVATDLISESVFVFVIIGTDRSEQADQPETTTATLADLRSQPYARIITQQGLSGQQQATGFPLQPTVFGSAIGVSGSTEQIVKQLILQECLLRDPIDSFFIAPERGIGTVQTISITGEPLGKKIEEVLAHDDFGDQVSLSHNFIQTYDVLQGNDRTVNSQFPQIFTLDHDNVQNISYKKSITGHINAVLVMGATIPATAGGNPGSTPPTSGGGAVSTPLPNTPVLTPSASPGRFQYWVTDDESIRRNGRLEATLDSKDLSTTDGMIDSGLLYLAQHPEVKQITFAARETAVERFGVDWQLGDLVTVERTDWGVTENMRVSQIDIEVGNPELRSDFLPQTVLSTAEMPPNSPENVRYAYVSDSDMPHRPMEFNLDVTAGTVVPIPSWRSMPTSVLR